MSFTEMKKFTILNIIPFQKEIGRNLWFPDSFDQHTLMPYFSQFMVKPFKDLGYEIEVKFLEDIDKSKIWFINLNINQGYLGEITSKLWDTIPSILLNELINGNAHLIINNENEYNTEPIFRMFYNLYLKDLRIPAKKIIFLSAGSDSKSIHKSFVTSANISKENQITVFYSCHIDFIFNNEEFLKKTNTEPKLFRNKKFICLNRAFRAHRPCLVAYLYQKNLEDKGFISLGVTENNIGDLKNLEVVKKLLYANIPNSTNVEHKTIISDIKEGMDKIAGILPLNLDRNDWDTNFAHWGFTPVEYIKDSYFSLVTSTHFFEFQEKSPGWNEKEWKPIICKHPFIIVNRPHILKIMKRLGFLTFNRWFDESYDDIEDDFLRLQAIVNEVERLSNISDEEWKRMYEQMDHILEYNRKIALEKRWENLFYSSDLKEFLTLL